MLNRSQAGSATLAIINVLLILALIGAGAFAWWAFQERQSYLNDFNKKLGNEVEKAKAEQKTQLEAEFAEKEKSPRKSFKGSATYGTVTFSYPKTWSGYVDQSNSNQPINGYFHPDTVPSITQSGSAQTAFALRVELVSTDYSQSIKELDSQISQGKTTAVAYVPPKMKGITNVQTGTKFDGEIKQGTSGSMVIIKVRDKTLKIYTQSPRYLSEFNEILKSLTFVP